MRGAADARTVTRATARERLLAGTSEAIGKRLRAVGVSVGAAPEFTPKQNSKSVGSDGWAADTAPCLKIGEMQKAGGAGAVPPTTATPMHWPAQPSALGSTISGDAPKVVVVRTNPGYAADPDHPGAATVVAIACGG